MASRDEFLLEHKDEIEYLENNKIKCLITNHELSLDRFDLIQAHWNGKSFRRKFAKKQVAEQVERVGLEKYAPYIVPHKRDPSKVYCQSTKLVLNRDITEIENHLKGRKFKYRLGNLKGGKVYVGDDAEEEVKQSINDSINKQGSDHDEEEEEDDDLDDEMRAFFHRDWVDDNKEETKEIKEQPTITEEPAKTKKKSKKSSEKTEETTTKSKKRKTRIEDQQDNQSSDKRKKQKKSKKNR